MSHAAAQSFQDWVARMLGLTEADRFVQTSSLAFGGAIRQVYAPLLAGGTVIPAPKGLSRDPDALVAFLRAHRITIWNSVPSLWVHLMDALDRTGEPDPLPDVRWVLLGGEAVPAAHVRRWRARFGTRIRLANLYGSTETVVNASWHEVVRDPDGVHTPIGWPRAGVGVHLVDGQIAVTGAIADGYLDGSPGFEDLPGLGRAYLTGDLARRDSRGALVYLGRRDSQVQVHGNRVELGDIEHTLVACPGVDHAAVVQDPDGRLHATVAGTASEQALRAWLSERLPHYMVPHRLDIATALPRTPAGKADRRALRARTPLAEAWMAVLGLDHPPAPDDDFFALGGDSLLLLAVLDRLRAHGAVPSPLALYARPTLEGMAAVLATPVEAPRPREAGLGGVQRGFWLAHQADADHPPVWCAEVPVRGPLDPDALREALNWLVGRHTALRTVIRPGPVQVVLPDPGPVLLQVDDLTAMPPELLDARWHEEAAARLSPEMWPTFRVRLVRLGVDDHRLLISAHHVVADAWSGWLLASELLQVHDALAEGRVPDLPPAPALADALPAEPPHDPWWDGALAGLRQPPARIDVACDARATLAPAGWDALRAEARRRSLSPFALVLTALFRTLAELVPGDDRLVCIAVAARDGADRVVGPLARALPVRVQGPPTADAVGAALRDAAAHADSAASGVVAAAGSLARLSRFFLSWLDPSAVPAPESRLRIDHAAGRFRFSSRDTEIMAGAVAGDALHVHLTGGPLVRDAAPVLERHLRGLATPECALVVYPPTGMAAPMADPLVVERVDATLATSELVLLPVPGSVLATHPRLFDEVDRAVRSTGARVVALGGWLPALTGLGTRPLGRPDQVVTTGHAATVVAMVRTVQRVLERTGTRWEDRVVGVLGYGAIGRAVLALAKHVLGEPREVLLCDPRLPDSQRLDRADLVLGATTGGRALDVATLRPGALVIDDSFPRAFDDAAAIARMSGAGDVVLVHGGMLDAGPLDRASPFPRADALRARYGARWLPGCHAEALLVAAIPGLGPTTGVVDVPRALAMWAAVERAGWDAAPLHLGPFEVPDAVWDRCA